ncbi:choline/ethanolamine kinase-like [Haliotis cracherodii]|uniref:choline/ethanolamine kinase-like n=1 Tax=Haliotis cracherodii TaxID=6455 RepID=UPI0039EBD450
MLVFIKFYLGQVLPANFDLPGLTMLPILLSTWKKILHILASLFGIRRGELTMEGDVVSEGDVRRKAYSWCRDSLHGSWAKITEDEIIVKHLSGGLTNFLYLCSLPKTLVPDAGEPTCVLLRIYGHIAKSSKEFVVHNSVVFALLSEKGMGPKLYGIYHDGRIEEYIPTQALLTSDLVTPSISHLIARKLAHFHQLDMPLCKEPRWLKNIVDGWLTEIKNNFSQHSESNPKMKKLMSFNLEQEFKELMLILSRVRSPVVFCHNDLQEGNILFLKDEPNPARQMTVIDWEYCSYNFRGFDIGNHFIEWCYDYTNPEQPMFYHIPDRFPSRKQQYAFFREYLKSFGRAEEDISETELATMYIEVNTYALGSHFMWGTWAIIQAETCKIEFGYWDYAISRFEAYFEMKKRLPTLRSED